MADERQETSIPPDCTLTDNRLTPGPSCCKQVDKIVGKTAPTDFLETVRELAGMQHPQMGVGFLRAYHCGQRLAVDVELTAPGGMMVAEAARIARELKSKASRMVGRSA